MMQGLNALARRLPTAAVYLAGMVPFALLMISGLRDRLGPDPVATLQDGLGLWALRFLLLSLSITPLMKFGLRLIRFRRALGLLAFGYAALHFTCWIALDMALRWGQILQDMAKRPYILAGLAAFAVLVPLAATSWDGAIRRLGPLAWRRLHRLAYVAVVAAAVHFVMISKVWMTESLLYLGAAVALLLLRLPQRSTGAKDST